MEGEDYDYIDDDVGCRDGGFVDGGVGGGGSGEVRGIFKEKYLFNIFYGTKTDFQFRKGKVFNDFTLSYDSYMIASHSP